MVANLGAAAAFAQSVEAPSNSTQHSYSDIIPKCQVIYLTAFFANHSWDVVDKVCQEVRGNSAFEENPATICFNLNGEYVCKDVPHVKRVVRILPKIQVT